MNFFGLARRSVFRKPIKSILLLLIVFAISTLLLAGVASKNASIEVQDKTRQAIGAGFLLERNAEYRTKRVREYSEKIGNDKEGSFGGYHQEKEIINGVETWSGWTTNEFESLDMLSFAVAPAVSKVTANYLVSQQVQQMQEEEKNNEGKVSTEYVAPKQDVQNISVEVTPEMYLLDGASVLVLITASVLVSGIVILKRNPKDILSEMS